jgi:hypothetical protein
MDFTSVIPGWHTTIFPPYFVAGACFQVLRWLTPYYYYEESFLEAYITIQHIELMNIVIMITGSIVGVAYITELLSLGILVLSMSSMLSEQSYWALLVGVFNDDVL